MKYISFLFILCSILYGCKNTIPKTEVADGKIYLDTMFVCQDEDEGEEVVEILEDTTWFSDYYAIEYGSGRGNFSSRISLYKLSNDSVIVYGEYPVDYDPENELILYREEDGERRLMLFDMQKNRLHEVKVPEEDIYREFGSWSCYSIGEVSSEVISVLFECFDHLKIQVKRI